MTNKFQIYKLSLSVLLFLFFLPFPVFARELVSSFTAEMKIMPDEEIIVMENIVFDFGDLEKYEIWRDIPYKYEDKNGRKFRLEISDIELTDGKGDHFPFDTENDNGYKRVRIGDRNNYFSGMIGFRLSYKIKMRGLGGSFYFPFLGSSREYPVKQTKVTVFFPEPVEEGGIGAECLSGSPGTEGKCVSVRYDYAGKNAVREMIFIDDFLDKNRSMGISFNIPGKIFHKNILVKCFDFFLYYYYFTFPLLVLFVGGVIFIELRKRI